MTYCTSNFVPHYLMDALRRAVDPKLNPAPNEMSPAVTKYRLDLEQEWNRHCLGFSISLRDYAAMSAFGEAQYAPEYGNWLIVELPYGSHSVAYDWCIAYSRDEWKKLAKVFDHKWHTSQVTVAPSGSTLPTMLPIGKRTLIASSFRVPITIVPEIPTTPTNQPPVVVVTPIITVQDSTTTTCMPILDPNGLGTNSFTVCGAPKHGTANPITTVGGQFCITYTPSSGYFGRDSICVIVCDNGSPSLCDTVNIPITVYPRVQVPTIPQPPIVSLPPIVTKEGVPVSICGPISDPNGSDTHTVTQCNVPLKGSVSGLSVNNSSHEVCLTYIPQAGQTGNDKVCLTVCDQGNLCVTVEVPVTIIPSNFPPACLTVELKVLLEGPFNPSTSKMRRTT